jgi:hypothetical protein
VHASLGASGGGKVLRGAFLVELDGREQLVLAQEVSRESAGMPPAEALAGDIRDCRTLFLEGQLEELARDVARNVQFRAVD